MSKPERRTDVPQTRPRASTQDYGEPDDEHRRRQGLDRWAWALAEAQEARGL